MNKRNAEGLEPDSRPTQVDVGELFSRDYNLAETDIEAIPPDDLIRIREDWIAARRAGNPLYVVGDDGRMFYVAVGGDGKAITLHLLVPRYEVQEGMMMEYAGPDAFHTLEEHLGHYQIVPMQQIEDSSVAAHVATVRDPIWFRAVRRLVDAHRVTMDNPYKK